MKKICLALCAALVLSIPLYAQTVTKNFRGMIGGDEIQMTLTKNGNRLDGNYYYLKVGKNLKLAGTIDSENKFKLDEFTANGTKSGEFTGSWTTENGSVELAGEWINPKNKAVAIFNAEEQMIFLSGDAKLSNRNFNEKNIAKKFEITAAYPVLTGVDSPSAVKFNQLVKTVAMKEIGEFRKVMLAQTAEEIKFARERGISNYLEMSYLIEFADDRVISIGFANSTYTGGAHPNHYSRALNFDLKTGRKIELAEIFKPNSNYLKIISDYCIKDLKKQNEEIADGDWVMEGAGAKAENFRSWNVRKDGILINFDPYQVASYAAGAFEVLIPFRELKDVLRENTAVSTR